MKKKILIVTDYYLPGYKAGGPIKSISTMCENLKGKFDIIVMTRNHDFKEMQPYKGILSNKVNSLNGYKVLYLSTLNLSSIKYWIKKFSPDIIHLNSFFSKFTFYILLLRKFKLISNNTKIILSPRGELSQNALSIKYYKKKPYIFITKKLSFYSDIIFHSTDKFETEDIKKKYPNKEIIQIENLTSNYSRGNIKIKKELNKLKIIYLSRITKKKNLVYALKILRDIDKQSVNDIIFDIYGPKEDIKYWKKCENIIKNVKNIKISYKGSVKPTEIMNFLSNYHLFFLPTKSENFGHAIVEAMQLGLIPLISDQTPWKDLERYKAGYAIPLNNEDKFIKAILEVKGYNQEEFNTISNSVKKYINSKLNIDSLVKEYIKMYEES